jgi:hypothetical protein
VIGAEPGPGGNIRSSEDVEFTTDEHSGAEGVGVDRDGNVYGSVLRTNERSLVFVLTPGPSLPTLCAM